MHKEVTPNCRALIVLIAVSFSLLGSGCSSLRPQRFVITPPVDGKYTSWREPAEQADCYVGEIIIFTGSKFRYVHFSDVSSDIRDYSGTVELYQDHLYLDGPGIPFPHRVAGIADGTPVLVTWEGYKQWKKTGQFLARDLLYHQKTAPNERTGFFP